MVRDLATTYGRWDKETRYSKLKSSRKGRMTKKKAAPLRPSQSRCPWVNRACVLPGRAGLSIYAICSIYSTLHNRSRYYFTVEQIANHAGWAGWWRDSCEMGRGEGGMR
jgi:hypothetical protein